MKVTAVDMAEQVRQVLAPSLEEGTFDPLANWLHLGILVTGMEERGYYLMLNTARTQSLRRVAAFHRTSERGFPCAGSSEWGAFATIGETVLRGAHQALFDPRAE